MTDLSDISCSCGEMLADDTLKVLEGSCSSGESRRDDRLLW